MDKETFEKKYTDVLNSLHLELVSEEFKEDLKSMMLTEIGKTSPSNLIAGYDYIPDED